jgi:hypothetical protein
LTALQPAGDSSRAAPRNLACPREREFLFNDSCPARACLNCACRTQNRTKSISGAFDETFHPRFDLRRAFGAGTAAKDDEEWEHLPGRWSEKTASRSPGLGSHRKMQEAIILMSRPRINRDGFSCPISYTATTMHAHTTRVSGGASGNTTLKSILASRPNSPFDWLRLQSQRDSPPVSSRMSVRRSPVPANRSSFSRTFSGNRRMG